MVMMVAVCLLMDRPPSPDDQKKRNGTRELRMECDGSGEEQREETNNVILAWFTGQ
jgi:hypothetical protein